MWRASSVPMPPSSITQRCAASSSSTRLYALVGSAIAIPTSFPAASSVAPPGRGVFTVSVGGNMDQHEKGAAFRALHEGETFVIPNPWDLGSARILEALGFRALATTSSGFAFTLGRLDGSATLDEVVEHVRELAAATSLPVSVDLENG